MPRFRPGSPRPFARPNRDWLPSSSSVAQGHESSIAFNRRYHMKDGTVGWNPGKGNPHILKPAGTIDPDVPVLFFETPGKKPVATYVNYAVHLDNIGEPLISADMPATLSRCLADFKGPEMVTLFTAGCCGDVNHIDVHWSEPQRGFGNPARMGVILAGEVLRTWPRLTRVEPVRLRIKSATVSLPLAELKDDDVEKARATVARMSGEASRRPAFMEMVQAFKVLDVAERNGKPHDVEVQVIALGKEVAWVSLPGEIFTELGLAIKQDSPFPCTIIAELANGLVGYIPSRRAYAQGNYEVVERPLRPRIGRAAGRRGSEDVEKNACSGARGCNPGRRHRADGGALGASPPALNGLSRFRNGQAVVFGRWSSTRRGAYHPDKVQIVREHGYSARATCLLRDGCSL